MTASLPRRGGSLPLALAFYAALTMALVVLALELQQDVLPQGIATRVGRNSEALLFALLVAVAVDATPPGPRTARTRALLLGAAGLLLVLGFLLGRSALPGTVATLNEAMIGGGLICAYLVPSRPWRGAPWTMAVTLLFIVLLFDSDLVLNQAESLVPFLLAPVALDGVERSTLRPTEPDRPLLRLAWMAFLTFTLLAAMAAAPWARESLDDALTLGVDYVQRAAEACWGWLALHTYFWISRHWVSRSVTGPASATPPDVGRRSH